MRIKPITYREGYAYQLEQDYLVDVGILGRYGRVDFLTLDDTGGLLICRGYAWDGPSGPAIDSRNFMMPSLVHDALYQLMRVGVLDCATHRKAADDLLYTHCRACGMGYLRAKWVRWAVGTFAKRAATPEAVRPVLTAP